MTKKLRNIIALLLVVVFILPLAGKFLDGLFHEHDHFHCTVKNEAHFHAYHEKCPIPNYKLSFFSVAKQIQPVAKQIYLKELKNNYRFVYYCKHSKYSFLLRAPPIFTNKIEAV